MATVDNALQQLNEMIAQYEAIEEQSEAKDRVLRNILKRVFQIEGLPWCCEQAEDTRCKRHYVMYYVQRMFDAPPTRLEQQENMVRLRVTFLFGRLPVMLSCNAKIEVLIQFLDTHLPWLTARVGRHLDDRVRTTEPRAAIADDVLETAQFLGKMYERDTYPAFRRSLKWAILDRIRQIGGLPLEVDAWRSEENQRLQDTVVLLFIFTELTDA
jgi:hypothetical protein